MGLPLPVPTFARMADVAVGAATVEGLLDALYTALSAANDYRGTVLPVTHRWTWERYRAGGVTTEAVYASAAPAGTRMQCVPQLILCGTQGAGPGVTRNLNPDDTNAAAFLYAGINKNGGAYVNYTAALPFTSGQFSGFWKADTTAANALTTTVRCFISEESVFIQILYPTNTQQSWIYFGAIVEPYVTDTVIAAEKDNRLYGMQLSAGTLLDTGFLSTITAWPNHSTVAGQRHGGVFTPGSSAYFFQGGRRNVKGAAASTYETRLPTGESCGDLFDWSRNSGTTDSNIDARYGTLRGIYAIGQSISGRRIPSYGAVDQYHIIGVSQGWSDDAIMVKAVP